MIVVFPRPVRRRGRARAVMWLGLLLFSLVAGKAAAARLLILPSQDQPIYQQLVDVLTTELADSAWTLEVLPAGAHLAPVFQREADLLIALGSRATARALAAPSSPPILSVFIPRHTFEALVQSHPDAAKRLGAGRLGAVYLEQPFSRQLDLVSLIAPGARTLGTLLGPASLQEQAALEAAGEGQGLQLLTAALGEEDNPIARLGPVIDHSDAFLAVPDRAIFNRRTARWILLMTLRQRIPLIAYSKRYVDAGAVAAVYSTTDTVGREAAALAGQWLQQGALPPPAYPQLFEVSTNPVTARSLGLNLPGADILEEALRSLKSP